MKERIKDARADAGGGRGERTTTAEALLGLLSMGPMSGYAIRQRIEESIGNFWSESYGQIYPALKRLVQDGLAELAPEKGHAGRPERKVYRLTAAGRTRLRAWLKTPSTGRVPRNEMLLKLFFAGQSGTGTARAQVEAFREEVEASLARYGVIQRRFASEYGRYADAPFWRMTLEYGVAEGRGLLGWCERTLEQLRRMEEVRDAS